MESLPDEIIVNIMQYLAVEDLLAFSETSQRYHQIAEEDSLWRWYLNRDFGYDDEDYDFFLGKCEGDTRRLLYIDSYENANSHVIKNVTDLTESIQRYPRASYSQYDSIFNRQKTLSKRMVKFVRDHVTRRDLGIGDVCFHRGSFTFNGITYGYEYTNCISDDVDNVHCYIKGDIVN